MKRQTLHCRLGMAQQTGSMLCLAAFGKRFVASRAICLRQMNTCWLLLSC